MTEAEWLASDDPQAMLRLACGRVSLCCGCVWCDNGDGTESMAAGQRCCPDCDNATPAAGYRPIGSDRKLRLFVEAHPCPRCAAVWGDETWRWRAGYLAGASCGSGAEKAALLRDIFGNPYRPVTREHLFPLGRGLAGLHAVADVLALARAAYDERTEGGTLDPHRLAVLADCLEDAGCPTEEECPVDLGVLGVPRAFHPDSCGCKGTGRVPNSLLAHLRSPGVHVKGCWALDLLLGKA